MARIKGGHTDPSGSRDQRPRAFPPLDSSQGGAPSSPPQWRYATWRPPTSPPPEPLIRFGLGPKAIIKRPMVTVPPIEGNSNCRAQPFHSKLYFDIKALRQQPEYHLEHLMTPREFFYPRVAMDFYQTMTTRDVPSSIAIHFIVDGRQGILEARDIA
ncbi:hypothetical protein AAG906_015288 [Vitis piasezkii]